MNRSAIVALLDAHSINFHEWGTGDAKTLEHLVAEIESGESTFVLLKTSSGACVNVFFKDAEGWLKLREQKQVFADGRVKERKDITHSVGEKMRPGADPVEEAYRALEEELGVTERLPLVPKPSWFKGPVPSISFPGLYSLFQMNVFDVVLTERWYRPRGYIEEQADKTNYYVWERISPDKAPPG